MRVNRQLLLERFCGTLLSLEPTTVLDVGCGRGALLEMLRDADVQAEGVELDAERVDEVRGLGLEAQVASATSLPFADASIDWVAMRHVLHHMEDPAAALREACRVARCGVLVAEPWNDRDIPSQRAMSRVDDWLRARHRESGHVHNENLSPAAIVEALAPGFAASVEVYLPLRSLQPEDLRAEMDGMPSDEESAELERLAETGQVTLPGTVIVTARATTR